jgi:iron(III) transport system permease protein
MSTAGLIAAPAPRRRLRLRSFDAWTVAALVVAALAAAPVLAVVATLAVPEGEVWRHLAETRLGRYTANSLWLMAGVALGTGIIGVGTAWLVTMCRFPGRVAFEWALLLPLAMPTYVIAYTYAGLLDFPGPVQTALRGFFGWGRDDYWFPEIRSVGGIAALFTLVFYPYVYLLARAAFLEQSVCVLEVSRTLGCSAWRSFGRVALPLARPAVAAGVALALMETLNDFGAVQHFAVDTFTTGIFRAWFGMGEPVAAAQLAAALLLFITALVLLERWSRRRARYHHTSTKWRPLPRYELGPAQALGAVLACLVPLALGFLVPGAVLVKWAAETAPDIIDARFWGFARNSLVLAMISAALAACLALLLAYAQRRRPGTAVAVRLAALGYAVPGSVVAVGLLLPLATIENAVDAAARSWLGVSTGLILTGGTVALVWAYLVRFLPVALGTVESGLDKVTPSVDGAARSLGQNAFGAVRRVHMPIIRGSILTGALLVFVDVMKELPATLIMRPFNFDTLAVRTYQLAGDELLREAAGPGLAIVLAGIVPVIVLSRAIARSRPGRAAGRS